MKKYKVIRYTEYKETYYVEAEDEAGALLEADGEPQDLEHLMDIYVFVKEIEGD